MNRTTPPATILCIEDEEALLEEIAEELGSAGHDVLTARDSAEAEAILARTRPDIILCDVMIPGRNGFELLDHLRRSALLPDTTAFIFLTALSAREPRLTGLRHGADDYLTKPVDLDLLHLTIRNRLDFVRRCRGGTAAAQTHLSPREEQVLTRIGQGERTIAIAHALAISEYTVNQYIKDIYRKLGINNRADAARAAIALGLVRAG